jgi:GIY-YIG catalytic domain
MHESFQHYIETLHPSFEKLLAVRPIKICALPKIIPEKCIYLFSEGTNHLYVGRTRRLRNRLRQHSIAGAQHNQAVFAFRLARELTGRTIAAYSTEGSRRVRGERCP